MSAGKPFRDSDSVVRATRAAQLVGAIRLGQQKTHLRRQRGDVLLTTGEEFAYTAEDEVRSRFAVMVSARGWKDSARQEIELPDLFSDQVSLGDGTVLYVHEDNGLSSETILDTKASNSKRAQAYNDVYEQGDPAGLRIQEVRHDSGLLYVGSGDHERDAPGLDRMGERRHRSEHVARIINHVMEHRQEWL